MAAPPVPSTTIMNTKKLPAFTRSYQSALRAFLKDETDSEPAVARKIGVQAMTIGLETLDLARVHQDSLAEVLSPDEPSEPRETMIRRATRFFAEANRPIELTHRGAREESAELEDVAGRLNQRTKELSDSNAELIKEIEHRRKVEESLRTSEQASSQHLEKSVQLQKELRLLSRRLLFIQEEERKRISRELHDNIAQTFASINLQLTALKTGTISDTKEFHQSIERTQILLEKSVEMVHRFARDLRPSLLDDFGLIPALESHLKDFMAETGVHVKLTAFANVEKLDHVKRTALYRVAQEALCNVAQHAEASRVEVKIDRRGQLVCMQVHDNGKGFQVDNGVLSESQNERLGLLGMRERVEMVGGSFSVDSTLGKETTVFVEIPRLDSKPGKPRGRKTSKRSPKSKSQ
jgi:signal transduction histidine kinase